MHMLSQHRMPAPLQVRTASPFAFCIELQQYWASTAGQGLEVGRCLDRSPDPTVIALTSKSAGQPATEVLTLRNYGLTGQVAWHANLCFCHHLLHGIEAPLQSSYKLLHAHIFPCLPTSFPGFPRICTPCTSTSRPPVPLDLLQLRDVRLHKARQDLIQVLVLLGASCGSQEGYLQGLAQLQMSRPLQSPWALP